MWQKEPLTRFFLFVLIYDHDSRNTNNRCPILLKKLQNNSIITPVTGIRPVDLLLSGRGHMTVRIVLVGVTDEQLRKSADTVPRGALVVYAAEGTNRQTFVAVDGNPAHLVPGLIVCMGKGAEFYYCGRRLRLLPTGTYQVDNTNDAHLYGTALPTFTSGLQPFKELSEVLDKPTPIGVTVRAILDVYGPTGLVQLLHRQESA